MIYCFLIAEAIFPSKPLDPRGLDPGTHPTFIIPIIQKRIERLSKNKIPAEAAVPNLVGTRDQFP